MISQSDLLEQITAPVVLTEIILSTGATITVQESRAKLVQRFQQHAMSPYWPYLPFTVRMRNKKGDVRDIDIMPNHVVLIGVETIWTEKAKDLDAIPLPVRREAPTPFDQPGVVNIGKKK